MPIDLATSLLITDPGVFSLDLWPATAFSYHAGRTPDVFARDAAR